MTTDTRDNDARDDDARDDARSTDEAQKPQQSKNRRKRLVILEDMQRRIILHTTMFPLIALTILTVTLTVFCKQLMNEAAAEEVHLPSLGPLLASVICLTACFAISILYVALRFSQRIAGPTYRMIQTLKEHQRGELTTVRLRPGDYLQELAEEINVVMLRESEPSSDTNSASSARDGVEAAPTAPSA